MAGPAELGEAGMDVAADVEALVRFGVDCTSEVTGEAIACVFPS